MTTTALVCFSLLCLSASPASVQATGSTQRSVSQYGITWTFAQPASVGRFITGDCWVVGPITVQSVTPAPTADRHGSVVNPPAGDKQGYDGRLAHFDTSLGTAFPLNLKPDESLVSTASVDAVGDRTADTVPGQYCRGPLRTAAVLTCVDAPPPADAFRPAYVGKWKTLFTASQLRRDRLPRLQAPGSVPDVKPYERQLERIWLDHQREWVNRLMHPLENMPDYGREITNIVSDVGLLVLLDDPDRARETLLLRFVQKGIDYYGVVQSDDNLWIGNGGHNSGRKWPILFAGLMLGHEGMSHVKATFQEDQQTYYGPGYRGQKALWTISPGNPNSRHEEVAADRWETFGDQRGNNGTKAEGYRKLNGPTWVGEELAARLTGMVDGWNHPAFFDYVDRWWEEEHQANAFVTSMWNSYRHVLSWLAFVPEMERMADLDGSLREHRWSDADGTKLAAELRRAQADWKTRAPTIQALLTPERVRSLSKWAVKQMEGYATVPSLEKAQLQPVALDEKQGIIVLESTVDTLPTHNPLVTRWLKAFVRYDTQGHKIVQVTITIRGQVLE